MIDIYYSFEDVPEEKYRLFILVDILRASSVVCLLHSKGAERIYFEDDLNNAFKLKEEVNAVILGEIGGERPAGFDLGNSPYEIMNADIRTKDFVHFTTNGTPLFKRFAGRKAVIGSFLNAAAVSGAVTGDTAFILAGTKGGPAYEDLYYAGYIASRFRRSVHGRLCTKAFSLYMKFRYMPGGLFSRTSNGRNLVALKKCNDISMSLRTDSVSMLPVIGKDRHGVFSSVVS